MFQGWDSFYLLIGSAAAGLIGLLFVVATLTANRDAASAMRGARIFMTPTVFHFAVALVISALALAPRLTSHAAGLLVAAAALVGLVYSVAVTVALGRGEAPETSHWSDLWCYGVAPAAIYVGLAAMAVALWVGAPCAAPGLAVLQLILLLAAVRNAWDLVTWLAPRRGD